jgi:23S rRNA (uracil1939-C5)-methyltransferase
MIVLHGEKGPAVEVEMDLPASVVWLGSERAQVLAGDGHLLIEILGVPFLVSAGSFFQVHTRLAEELVRHVMVALDPRPGEVIYDLYAGVGLFSAFIAEAGARVIGVEASAQAGADFETNLDDYTDVELYVASVERALPALTAHPDGMIVDPPRAGLGREVVQALVDLSPSRLIYVSCDPATLARDAKMLAGSGYHLESVRPFDLFPQTYHIETLSFWSR